MSTHVNKRGPGGGRWSKQSNKRGATIYFLIDFYCNVVWWNKNVKSTLQEKLSKNLILDIFLMKLSSLFPPF